MSKDDSLEHSCGKHMSRKDGGQLLEKQELLPYDYTPAAKTLIIL